MDSLQADKKFAIEIRVRGKSGDDVRGHEWRYFHFWNSDSLAQFLRVSMRKSEREVRLLMHSYDRFQVDVAIQSEHTAGLDTDELLNAG